VNDLMPLVEPLIPGLRRYARALLKDRAAADDLVQDCLERVITRWSQRHGDVRSWVFTILHNLAMSRFRQTARRGTTIQPEDAEALLSEAPPQESRLLGRDILAALDALPDDQRSVVLLVGVEDLSYADAAKVLGVPVGTVMSRLSRGRERVRQFLENGPAEPVRLRSVK
jgi:RNA polymerase sigma-70 factor (ECF subfamily)